MEIRRPWYDASATDRQQESEMMPAEREDATLIGREDKFSPNVLLQEPGAVLCRVSKSFLRVGQLEIFAKRGETRELLQLADYVCYREFPQLLHLRAGVSSSATLEGQHCVSDNSAAPFSAASIPPGTVDRYIEMYREIIKGTCDIFYLLPLFPFPESMLMICKYLCACRQCSLGV